MQIREKSYSMKKLVTALLCVFYMMTAQAQQDPQFSLNMFNNPAINPAAAGMENGVSASALIREQWISFPGKPSTQVFNVNSSVPFDAFPFGAGLTIMQDQLGFSKNTLLDLSIAPHFELGIGTLGVGIGLGFNNQAFSNVEWTTSSGQIVSDDPTIPKDESVMAFDLSAGAYLQGDAYWAGISVRHLNSPSLSFSEQSNTFLAPTAYFSGGYHIPLPNPLFELTPSVLIKSDFTVLQADITATLEYDKRLWGGVTYRLEDAYVAMFGINLVNGISIGFAWDFPANDVGTYAAGSVEFFGRYIFDLGLKSGKTGHKSSLNRDR